MPTESVLVRKDLMDEAFGFCGLPSKGDLLNSMLEDFVLRQRKFRELMAMQGTVEYFDDSNLKGYKSK